MVEMTLFFMYAAAFIWIILLAEFSYRKLKLNPEWTRKIVHIGTGIVALTAPYYGVSIKIVLALTILFTIIFYYSKKMKMFPAIFNIERVSYGELLFAWSTFFLFVIYKKTGNVLYFYLPFSTVVFADSAAALVGKVFPVKRFLIINPEKSYGGSAAFFIVAFLLSYKLLPTVNEPYHLLYCLANALILTIIEAVSTKGWDNFFISIVSVLIIFGFQ